MNKMWYKRWWAIMLLAIFTIILIFLVAFSFYVIEVKKRIQKGELDGELYHQQITKTTQYQNTEGFNSPWLGSAKPKVTIVEFGDFNCPMCKNAFTKIREISLKYKDNVKIVFRNFPVRDGSIELAMASLCAEEQGLFWPMHDKLLQNQGSYDNNLVALAKNIGADSKKFENCLKTNKYLTKIQQDYSDGEKFGVIGTPTWFINGYKIQGDVPYDIFIQIVESFIND
jgi:protein-disulfide isomerase